MAERVECKICLEEYQEDELEVHREMCMARLMFRCSICDGEYVSKEGLWNHLDLHEIADESKKLHYQEMRAKFKLHQCALCNDQRAYQKNPYWKHVHEEHEGFFLRCTECGESFRSQELKNNHDITQCKPKEAEQITLKMEISVEETTFLQHDDFGKSTPIQSIDCPYVDHHSKDQKVKNSELSSVEFSAQESALTRERKSDILEESDCASSDQDIVDSQLNEHSPADLNVSDHTDDNMIEKESEMMAEGNNLQRLVGNTLNTTSEAKCSHCGKEFSSVVNLARHIELSHQPHPCHICGITLSSYRQAQYHKMTMHTEPKHRCPHCPRKFHKNNDYHKHLSVCVGRSVSCELCGLKFKNLDSVNTHKKRTHSADKGLKKPQIDQKGCNQEQDTINSEQLIEDNNSRRENTQPLAENQSLQCSYCGKDFASVKSLSYHIEGCHKPTTCNICGMLFPGKDTARYHKKTKHTEPKYQCAKCPMKYYQKSNYEAHLNICDKRRLPCKLCGQMFHNLVYMKGHLRRVHHIKGDLSEFVIGSTGDKNQQEHKQAQCTLKKKISLSQHDDRGKSSAHKSTITDCPDLNQNATIQVVVDPEPSFVNSSGQSSALTQTRSPDTHNEIDHPNDFMSSDRDDVDCQLTEHSPANPHNTRDSNNVINKKPKVHPITSMNGSSETKVMSENSLQPLVNNLLSRSLDTKCTHCGKECSSFFALARHIEMIHVPQACDVCGINFPSYVKARYHKITKHTKPKRKCPHCPKIFHGEKNYQIHLPYCVSKKFSCELCDQKFKASKYVVRHMSVVHKVKGPLKKVRIDRIDCEEEPEKNQVEKIVVKKEFSSPFIIIGCPLCGKNFGDQSQVTHHVEAIHQMTMCTSCGMTFTSADQLNDHKLTCPQHLKHVDSQCSTDTASQPHGETSSSGLSGTVCPHCDKDCCHEALLARHVAWFHQPVVCSTCGVTLSGKNRMSYHKMKFHSKLFKCPHCSKTFPLKANYLRHVSNHMQDSKFDCKLCDRKFKKAVSLEDHIRRMHHVEEYKSDRSDCNELESELQPCDDVNLIQGENMELNMEIKVEATTLQEQDYQAPDEDCGKSPNTTIIIASRHKVRKRRMKPKFSCKKCHRAFPGIKAFQKHANEHMKKKNRNVSDFSHEANDQIVACSICEETFESWSKMKYHVQVCHSERKYKCSLCPLTFHFSGVLRRHEKLHSKISKLFCNKCNLKFTSKHKLNYHMKRSHAEPDFKCPDCGKLYNVQYALRNHMTICLKAKRKRLRENKEILEQQFDDDLEQNQNSSLQNVKSEPLDHENEIEIKNECLQDEDLSCSICGRIFEYSHRLEHHKRTAHTEPQHKCPYCPKMFHLMSTLHRHEAAHNKFLEINVDSTTENSCQPLVENVLSESSDTKCAHCGKECSDLARHIERNHMPHACDICGITFPSVLRARYHKSIVHTEPKHKCSHCPKTFQSISKLNRHETTHSKIQERNVICKLCPKSFRDEHDLQRHVNSAHPPSELPCDMCDLKFSTESKLKYHVNTIHKPRFKCLECDKPFHAQYAFRKHMDIHSNPTEKKRRRRKAKGGKPILNDSARCGSKEKQKLSSLDDPKLRRSNRVRAKE